MKNSISITVDSEILEEIKKSFPNEKRSQIIEEALEFWIKEKKKNKLKEDAKKLMSFHSNL